MLNLNRSNFQAHPFHLVSPSPWPLYTSSYLLSLTTSAVLSFHGFAYAESCSTSRESFTTAALDNSLFCEGCLFYDDAPYFEECPYFDGCSYFDSCPFCNKCPYCEEVNFVTIKKMVKHH